MTLTSREEGGFDRLSPNGAEGVMNGRTDDVVRRPPEMPALVSLPLRVAGMT